MLTTRKASITIFLVSLFFGVLLTLFQSLSNRYTVIGCVISLIFSVLIGWHSNYQIGNRSRTFIYYYPPSVLLFRPLYKIFCQKFGADKRACVAVGLASGISHALAIIFIAKMAHCNNWQKITIAAAAAFSFFTLINLSQKVCGTTK